jgi:hypothetical protein
VHAKCNFPLPEEEAYQAQLLASQQEHWQGGQASPTAAAAPAAAAPRGGSGSHAAAFSEAVCIPSGEPASQPRPQMQHQMQGAEWMAQSLGKGGLRWAGVPGAGWAGVGQGV